MCIRVSECVHGGVRVYACLFIVFVCVRVCLRACTNARVYIYLCACVFVRAQVYSREENEGDEILGRAGDGVFKRERYVFHVVLPAAQVAIVATDQGVFCMSVAAHDMYYTVQWRVHFKGNNTSPSPLGSSACVGV